MNTLQKFTVLVLIIAVSSLGTTISNAQSINSSQAQNVAKNFYINRLSQSKLYDLKTSSVQDIKLSLVHQAYARETIGGDLKNTQSNTILYYIFNVENQNGFVIVSADQRVTPILGYAFTGKFDENEQSPAFSEWLENYGKQIIYIIQNNVEAEFEIEDEWTKYSSSIELEEYAQLAEVLPLLSTTWNQGCYYNAMCPEDELGPCGHALTGCVATAMAQIMKYWNSPVMNNPIPGYTHSVYGWIPDLGTTSYEWSQMTNSLGSTSSGEAIDAVSEILYHCGVSVQMSYGPAGSFAGIPRDAFVEYFNYSPVVQYINRSYYPTSDWINTLKGELENNRPVYYRGSNLTVGHAFVCDGYQDNDYFHFNWGWGGYSDGYFYVDDLVSGFNYFQAAVVYLSPEWATDDPMIANPIFMINHYGDDEGNEDFYLNLSVHVSDPQGPYDIQSVMVATPDPGIIYLERNEFSPEKFSFYQAIEQAPAIGEYTFTVTDFSGNSTTLTRSLEFVMDFPRNLTPADNSIITAPNPVFSWDAVYGADSYDIVILDQEYNQIWSQYGLTNTSVVFNNDNTGTAFVDGQTYVWYVSANAVNAYTAHRSISFTYSSAPEVPQPPTITDHAIINNTDLQFTFNDISETATLNVYGGVIAYFSPDKVNGTNRIATHVSDEDPGMPGFQWTDQGAIGNASTNYFYVFTAVDGSESENSITIGEFDFDLVATPTTDFNEIALPLNMPGITNAEELLAAIPGCNSVARWDANMQGYYQYVPFIPETNFEVTMGYPYYVNVTGDLTFTLVGEIVNPSFNLITTPTTDFNEVMLTLDKTTISNASDLMADITTCNSIAWWSSEVQGFEQYVPFIPETNFDVRVGYPYYVNVTSNVTWPGTDEGSLETTSNESHVKIARNSPPHLVYGTIQINNSEMTMDDLDFLAYFPSSPDDKLTKNSAGCILKNGYYIIQCNTFSSGWGIEEPLLIEIRNKDGLLLQSTVVQLSYEPADKAVDFAVETNGSDILLQNVPNPFSEETAIQYQIPFDGKVLLEVYSLTGQKVKTLVNEYKEDGRHEVIWSRYDSDNQTLPDGIYVYVLKIRDRVVYKRATIFGN